MNENNGSTLTPRSRTQITCDQAAWLNDALDRFSRVCALPFPAISRAADAAAIACAVEIAEILNLEFDDEAKRHIISRLPEITTPLPNLRLDERQQNQVNSSHEQPR